MRPGHNSRTRLKKKICSKCANNKHAHCTSLHCACKKCGVKE